MPTAGTLRVGQVAPNTYWVTVSQGGAVAAFDFTTVSAASIVVKKPSGATQTWTTVLSAQTTTGLTATHSLVLGDVDEAGTYTGYLLMTVSGGTIRSESSQFYVAEEFAEVDSNEVPGWIIAGAIISGGGGGTVPTGTGIPHIVGGVQNAAASLIVDADVSASAAITPSKIAPAGTNGWVMTTTAGVTGWAAASGGGSVPTGSGFYTVTGGVADAAARAAATGIYTWLATPSSANLAAALTDETGTGEVVFSTTPTFKTSVKVNNPANTFAYTLTPAAIAANRTLTLPLLAGNDTMVCEAFTQTLTNKTIDAASNTVSNIANANVSASAAIAVSKLAAGSNTQVLTTTGGVPVWAAPATPTQPTGTGFYTVTGGVMDAAAAPAGTGVLTFLSTPSSANLRAALTDETGTGEAVFSTSPTFKTGVLLNNPANTFAYTFTPAAIAAARTITLPLLTGNDTMVTEAFTQTLTNKTINGSSNTITNVAISTAVSGLGAGVAAFLGTPSSANLRTALTDETGTGSAVFATSPTLTTPVFSSIVNTGTLTLPTSTDTLVGRATTDTLTNKTIAAGSNTITGIADANVAAGAAIAGTKISPDFGSQLIQTSGNALATNILATGYFHTSGSPTPTSGQIRLENTHKIATRNAGNTANICIASGSAGDVVFYGLNPSYTEQAYGVIAGATGYVWLAVNSAFYIKLESSEVRTINPVVGDVSGYASPYGCHGAVVSAMTDANYTVPDSEYKYYTIQFTCVGATTRTVTFPHPSSLARSYTKNIKGSTEKILTISTGTGTTVDLNLNKSRIFEFTNGGVRAIGPEY